MLSMICQKIFLTLLEIPPAKWNACYAYFSCF